MNRKLIRGRASPSSPAAEETLDMDYILETKAWNEIDEFVRCILLQNILNEFAERIALDPNHAPSEYKSSTYKRPTPSSRGTRKNQAAQTNKGKKKANNVGGPKSVECKTEIGQKSESSGTKASNGYEAKDRVSTSKEKGKKLTSTGKPATNREAVGNSLKMRCPKQSTPRPVKQNVEAANVSTRSVGNMADANSAKENSIITGSRSRNSKLPFKTSTPMCELSKTSNSLGKKSAIGRNNATAVGKKFSATCDASIKKSGVRRKCAARDLNNNCNKLEPAGKVNKNAAVICKNEAATTSKITEKKRAPTSRQSETSKCDKQNTVPRDGKLAIAEKKTIGKFEQRLLDERARRERRKINRDERKAERAMEKFSHHVSRLVQKMRYLADCSSSSSSCSDDGDFSDESSYTDFSDESSFSDSCCSNSSSEYTEYFPCSSSD